jgi:UDP-glucuronate 4-epimerase
MSKVLVTGGAGFIGSHLVDKLIAENWDVTVLDNFDPFYDVSIKLDNITSHHNRGNFNLVEVDLRDRQALRQRLTGEYDVIVHLAAKAGVRPSIADPTSYQDVNVGGTQNLLELAKEWGVKQFVFASSSSVYGVNPRVPWSEEDRVLLPISPYASTKVSGELLGHVYSHLYGMRFIGLRLFTVYGPRQRPDLAIHKFARLILTGAPLPVFGDGSMSRDYTFIDDIVRGIRAAMAYEGSQYEIVNLGNMYPVTLLDMVTTLAKAIGVEHRIKFTPEQPGDVPRTFASIQKAKELLGYKPSTSFGQGIDRFVSWLVPRVQISAQPNGEFVWKGYKRCESSVNTVAPSDSMP